MYLNQYIWQWAVAMCNIIISLIVQKRVPNQIQDYLKSKASIKLYLNLEGLILIQIRSMTLIQFNASY